MVSVIPECLDILFILSSLPFLNNQHNKQLKIKFSLLFMVQTSLCCNGVIDFNM